MSKRLLVEPRGWPCSFFSCPPGPFIWEGNVCLKTEYGCNEAYNETGEVFWGGVDTPEERAKLIVQPCIYVWNDKNQEN